MATSTNTIDTRSGSRARTEPRAHSHAPGAGKHQPITTYRLQMGPQLTFAQAQEQIPYFVQLGVSDLYLSPILQAAPGSTHGYDVVDHSHISAEMGGRGGFEEFSRAAHAAGLHVVVDVVPNHMAVPTPLYRNKALWAVLRDGTESEYSGWFDLDLSAAGDGVLMPVLGDRIGNVLARAELTLDSMVVPGFEAEGETPVLRYFDRVFPVRAGTENLPLAELVDQQFYRLAYWRVANEELNYRRFFDVDTLVAIRVEDDAVFAHSHQLLLELYRAGLIDGFRIDHPDGLADPREYLRKLHRATEGAWIVAEKILEGTETLPSDWPCAGTTGYDSARRIQGLFTDPSGLAALTQSYVEISGNTAGVENTQIQAKRDIIATSLYSEIDRLATLVAEICHRDVRLRDHTFRSIRQAIAALAVHMDRYRAYVVPGETAPAAQEAVVRAAQEGAERALDPELRDTLALVADLFLGKEVGSAGRTHNADRATAIIRFQQLTGPVMAKGVEDTTFYRYTALLSANEVGSGPEYFTCTPDEFHAWEEMMHNAWPTSMNTLTTHDTKRGEDVRAQIAVLSEYPKQWHELLTQLREHVAPQRPRELDGRSEVLLWQTLIGTWEDTGPIEWERLQAYLVKAVREQKSWTSWIQPNEQAEAVFITYAQAIFNDPHCRSQLAAFHELTAPAARAIILGQKVLEMAMVGVPDLYQGEEIPRNWLVDPDNRAPVDFAALRATARSIADAGAPDHSLTQEKWWITSRMAHLRLAHPYLATPESAYEPLPVTTGHVFAFARTDGELPQVLAVVTRLYGALTAEGGFAEQSVVLPEGEWRNAFTETTFHGGEQLISDVLGRFPVAALERLTSSETPTGQPRTTAAGQPHTAPTAQLYTAPATQQNPRSIPTTQQSAQRGGAASCHR
ncbi:MAG: malto-oligosyltrehalose synthase [Arcanobacterium sp.]|nr:malto-oligosyltrehalose synthase [Arcanobacterium sp.]MDY5588432.1 malto-oligosyltrehalose synthase [Arcanobacterium sp.]